MCEALEGLQLGTWKAATLPRLGCCGAKGGDARIGEAQLSPRSEGSRGCARCGQSRSGAPARIRWADPEPWGTELVKLELGAREPTEVEIGLRIGGSPPCLGISHVISLTRS